MKSQLLDHTGRPFEVRSQPKPQAYLSSGSSGSFYDAVNFTGNRADRPFFAADSRVTLNQWTRTRAMGLSRWAYINVPYVRGAVDLAARLTVGTGFSPQTLSANQGLAALADQYYLEKTASIGFMNGESMDEMLLHDCRCADLDGDLGEVMTTDEFDQPKLQLIEGHRIKTGEVTDPRCRDGVWVDDYGRRVAYNIALPEQDQTRRIETQNFIYLSERNRPDELRSMTSLIHALAPLQDLYEIIGFTMQSAKKNSELAATLETPTPEDTPFGPIFETAGSAAIPASEGIGLQPATNLTREQVYGSGGKIPVLRPGEKLNTWQHASPSPTIAEWSEFIIRGIAVGYSLPFEVFWNPETIGGANTRMITALLRARLIQRRNSLIFPKLNRVRFWILARGIKRGEIPFSPDLFKCSWNPNFSDITVDAGRESRERRANVQSGLDTYTGYYSENGEAYADQVKVRQSDAELQCQAAQNLCEKFPQLSFNEALARIVLVTPGGTELQQATATANQTT